MVTYHGSTVLFKLERILAEGKIIKELLGTLDGSAGNQTFYTKNFPITTNVGVATDDETLVDVYSRVPPSATQTEYDEDGSDYTIVGATGAVVIQAAENQAGDAGQQISISYYTSAYVGRGQGGDLSFDTDIISVYELGSRMPQELHSGDVKVSGTINALYVSRDLLGKVLGVSDLYGRLADFSFYIYPNGIAGGQPYIKVGSATFSGGKISVGQNTVIAANVSFQGLALTIGTN